MICSWGLPPLAGATLQGSQVCSALRGLRPLGLAFGHPCTSLGRSTVFFLWAVFFGGWAVLGPWAEA
ncbi:hypothetical protein OP864_00165 [Saprospira grandis]|nr:hypothetical protein [Saprospira grandis]WBM74655.1 hypothetical protein OP864_00165 [Saprospira grandis]